MDEAVDGGQKPVVNGEERHTREAAQGGPGKHGEVLKAPERMSVDEWIFACYPVDPVDLGQALYCFDRETADYYRQCVNAMDAAGITRPEELPLCMAVVRCIASNPQCFPRALPELDAALAALAGEEEKHEFHIGPRKEPEDGND